ncbi:TPA_asm: hypothetical protein vir515_00049 [Caudoviricetes sp. vir515]|jgi:hypothetical protein|nr:TPA_asm: hypothetical protein vir515_00049 [Caudoviricetes sp. vir515]
MTTCEELLATIYPEGIPRDHYPRLPQVIAKVDELLQLAGSNDVASKPIEISATTQKKLSKKTRNGRPSGLPADGEIIEEIMKRKREGRSARQIHEWLKDQGIRTSYKTLSDRIRAEEQRISEESKTIEGLREKGATVTAGPPKPSTRTEELRKIAIATGNTRAVEPQAPLRGREVRGDEEVMERYGIGPDGLDLSDVDMGVEVAD